MNLLEQSVTTTNVIDTGEVKIININNENKKYKVYKIELEQLYYNDQNDRIATWISKYKSENNIVNFDITDTDSYNKIIHNFISESNLKLLQRTEKNIKLIGQQEVGVVLSDGRIIDGNRRFTCLRNIQKVSGKKQYFKAIILDQTIQYDAKQIKMLELRLQHGVDEKVGYSPIDRLVGIYNDIVDKKLLTVNEYATSVNQSDREINLEVEKAKLMVEFLDFINSPKEFHLARDFNIIDPLKELHTALKKISDPYVAEDFKRSVFSQYVMYQGDTTRYARKIKKIVSDGKYVQEYVNELEDVVEDLCDMIKEKPHMTTKDINFIRENRDMRGKMERVTEKYTMKVNSSETKNLPIKLIDRASDSLESIDTNVLSKLSDEQIQGIFSKLSELERQIIMIKSSINE